jgi:hypothetical protein
MAVGRDGTIYVANDGISDVNPDVPGSGGELVRINAGSA